MIQIAVKMFSSDLDSARITIVISVTRWEGNPAIATPKKTNILKAAAFAVTFREQAV